ncbi:Crp/Fnr family transcriptional regulator [Chryseobacterium lactis]|uniref:Crp/Fnr family transcriptional regulator n=1 Tax=Chryseobacterium lactis TaxID=1241981 RepID=A0A3G6RLB5_CHRLC|nr:Crp/Fnr family transcriptional regulator [Chryseobacterium lactis]AZA83624.1 Crp/Fnr family transcriptional regulator [Chryseobacterium lactis]AZB04009.1 Crp/Fnr family transcriptional regulator [Chryseobacterium lactis]PNW13082.1 Crp/Fnr family transcriptional regulator [Chryseobacterium lactis]
MNTSIFLEQINQYYPLSDETVKALLDICTEEKYNKNDLLLEAGSMARYYYFVESGLIGYYTVDEQGSSIYKIFFEENSFVASTAAVIKNEPSEFTIIALEDCSVIKYPVKAYRELLEKYHDLALFHLYYLEKNWVVKKEPLEVSLKYETAKQRYLQLLENKSLYTRLKQHQIASYLGVTPTQLSRIKKEMQD